MSSALASLFVALALACATAQGSRPPTKATLIGLDPAAVEAKIGKPDEKDELADSDEAYWIYKTKAGTLTVHFQNHVVISYTPEDFPLEQIWKSTDS